MTTTAERTDEPRLEVDAEIEGILDDPASPLAGFSRWFKLDPERALLGTTRLLRRQMRRVDDLMAARAAVLAEYERTLAPLQAQIKILEAAVESEALARREEGRGNSLVLPGIGTWETRRVPGRWKVEDPDAVAGALTGSERERYLVPQPDKLDARALLADVDAVLESHGGEILPGLTKGEERISVTAKYAEGAK
jgi:phage host-nuclease inhibitor protein Gam